MESSSQVQPYSDKLSYSSSFPGYRELCKFSDPRNPSFQQDLLVLIYSFSYHPIIFITFL